MSDPDEDLVHYFLLASTNYEEFRPWVVLRDIHLINRPSPAIMSANHFHHVTRFLTECITRLAEHGTRYHFEWETKPIHIESTTIKVLQVTTYWLVVTRKDAALLTLFFSDMSKWPTKRSLQNHKG